MECPFELPVEADEKLLMLHINGKLRASLIIGDVDNWDDEKRLLYLRYIVHAINSHEKLVKALKRYGHHDSPCAGILDLNEDSECACGFDQALKEAEDETM